MSEVAVVAELVVAEGTVAVVVGELVALVADVSRLRCRLWGRARAHGATPATARATATVVRRLTSLTGPLSRLDASRLPRNLGQYA